MWVGPIFLAPMLACAAVPQPNPAHCPVPLAIEALAAPATDDIEACLKKVGNRNFSRKGKTLTIHWGGGVQTYKDKPVDGEGYEAFRYAGYDARSGFHVVQGTGYEWTWTILIDHNGGQTYSAQGALPGSVSPDRRFVFSGLSEQGCGKELYVDALLPRGQKGKTPERVELSERVGVCREGTTSVPQRVDWLDAERARITWSCGDDRPIDQTMLVRINGQWQPDRLPCHSATAAQPAYVPNNGKLAVGMSVAEVEVLLGGDAQGYQVDPLDYFGKKRLTRYWMVKSRKLLVDFENDQVIAWRY
ncbi:hypothetical protein [Jeongeupia sp. HS-3]|uniref:hypothetical protein n=1 Tax=Jeongeupia sp. HS-3 TaxID=1009682 RepID=UPI0019104282|nr:hypothetical protein [Jeongeupia sp. HS-3]